MSSTGDNLYPAPREVAPPAQAAGARRPCPDPAGLPAARPARPRARNFRRKFRQETPAYAYVANQPLRATDPLGLGTIGPCGGANDGKYAWINCGSVVINNLGGPVGDFLCGSGEPWQQLDPSCREYGTPTGGGIPIVVADRVSSQAPANPIPPVNACPRGVGLGVVSGASAEAGVLLAGAGAQTSVALGGFDSADGASAGAIQTGGADAYAGPLAAGAPHNSGFPASFIFGAFAGASIVGGELTNAGSPSQLAGPFDTWTLNLGIGIQGTFQLARGANGIWAFSVSLGPGIGADVSRYDTDTAVRAGGGCA